MKRPAAAPQPEDVAEVAEGGHSQEELLWQCREAKVRCARARARTDISNDTCARIWRERRRRKLSRPALGRRSSGLGCWGDWGWDGSSGSGKAAFIWA